MDLHRSTQDRQERMAVIAAEFGDTLADLNWISEARARTAEAERAKRLTDLSPFIQIEFKQTKPHSGPLSPGCRICGQGGWSCLFINGKCNCRCFYCPTPQDELGVPTTNRIFFEKATDYAAYVRSFNFSGVSISGGEPLLTFNRTRRYIQMIRQKMGVAVHIWLYTNATLLTHDHLLQLKDDGLDEIRIDISAADYNLKKMALAVGIIPCVTVEIPAIPEDYQTVANLLPQMRDLGLNHLNLHQLRLTPHNRVNFKHRPYTFFPGEKVTVVESEEMALALIQETLDKGIELPINYCSFVYKNRYQRAASRRRNAHMVLKDHESITENGYIRVLALQGASEVLSQKARQLDRSGINRRLWQLSGKKDRLFFHPQLCHQIQPADCNLLVSYAEAGLSPHLSYQRYFKEIRVTPDKRLYVEKQTVLGETRLNPDLQSWLINSLSGEPVVPSMINPNPTGIEKIAALEFIEPGLQSYLQ